MPAIPTATGAAARISAKAAGAAVRVAAAADALAVIETMREMEDRAEAEAAVDNKHAPANIPTLFVPLYHRNQAAETPIQATESLCPNCGQIA